MRRDDQRLPANPMLELRKKLDMTQAEIAAALEISRDAWNGAEYGTCLSISPKMKTALSRIGFTDEKIADLAGEYLEWKKRKAALAREIVMERIKAIEGTNCKNVLQ